ncbi:MAG: hypothetical protein CL398_08405 [Acidiferrobacteraceae bacterium]|nr:hypothetical protein [Acidiferrobacteraceae bacterium]
MTRSYFAILVMLVSCTTVAYDKEDLQQFIQTNRCVGCDLSGVDLSNKNLQGANLSGANLSNASFMWSRLIGVDLRFSQLRDADFRNATISGDIYLLGFYDGRTDFRSADLRGADFTNAVFRNVRIDGAIIDETTILPKDYPDESQVAMPYELLETFEIRTSCPSGTKQTYRGCE